MNKENYLYPNHPVRCIIIGPSECGKSVFLTNLSVSNINEYKKNTSTHEVFIKILYQNIFKCFSNYIPIHIIPNILNEEDIDIKIDEIVNSKDFEKSDIEIATYESKEDIKFPQEYENISIVILDDLNQKENDDPRVQAMFKRSKHNNLSIFIISQDYNELSKKIIRCIGNIYHIFKPNNFLDVRNIYEDKASMDMTLDEFKYLTSFCWDKQHQPLTIDMTKDKQTGRNRLGLNSIFLPETTPF